MSRLGLDHPTYPRRSLIHPATLAVLATLLMGAPAFAHHGKDFLLTATDDMPKRGHAYLVLSVDDFIERGGGRGVEITPGVLFSLSNRFSLEPHAHIAREEDGSDYRYAATAVEARYRAGFLGRGQWRWGGVLEYEAPRGEEHDNLAARLMFIRTCRRGLVAVNLVAERDLESGGRTPISIIAGVLRPISPSDNVGLEVDLPFPAADGVEILPGIYHLFGGPEATTSLKVGVGLFVSRDTTSGTFRTSLIRRF